MSSGGLAAIIFSDMTFKYPSFFHFFVRLDAIERIVKFKTLFDFTVVIANGSAAIVVGFHFVFSEIDEKWIRRNFKDVRILAFSYLPRHGREVVFDIFSNRNVILFS